MQIQFIKIFSFLKICLSTDYVLEPIIEIQPRMNLKCISVNYDLCNGFVGNIPVTEWRSTSNSGLFIVELKFVVNYRNFLSYYTPTQKIVTLKRYKKKQIPDEQYDKSLHTPQNILLPDESSNRTIYKIDILVSDREGLGAFNNIDEKRDVISFHSRLTTPAKSVSDITKLNKLLLTYMVEDIDELSSAGFQFSFTVTAEGRDGEVVIKTVVSNLFGFSHCENLSFLTECILDPDDYHMALPPEPINEGIFTKIKRFFRRRKK